jgi:hypothetical protein
VALVTTSSAGKSRLWPTALSLVDGRGPGSAGAVVSAASPGAGCSQGKCWSLKGRLVDYDCRCCAVGITRTSSRCIRDRGDGAEAGRAGGGLRLTASALRCTQPILVPGPDARVYATSASSATQPT